MYEIHGVSHDGLYTPSYGPYENLEKARGEARKVLREEGLFTVWVQGPQVNECYTSSDPEALPTSYGEGDPHYPRQVLVWCAKEIARLRSYQVEEDDLQPYEHLETRYREETNEFKDALMDPKKDWRHILLEAADVLYCAARREKKRQDGSPRPFFSYEFVMRDLQALLSSVKIRVPREKLEELALAKYKGHVERLEQGLPYRSSKDREPEELALVVRVIGSPE